EQKHQGRLRVVADLTAAGVGAPLVAVAVVGVDDGVVGLRVLERGREVGRHEVGAGRVRGQLLLRCRLLAGVSAWEVARWVPPAVAIRAIEAVSATAPVSSGRRFLSPGQAITGRSTKRYSSHASGIATAPSSSRTAWESVTSSPAATCGITCSGQCTRYSE